MVSGPSAPGSGGADHSGDYALVRANSVQQAERWRHHHHAWGEGFDPALYLRREAALCDLDYCRAALTMWLLCDVRGQPLASLETYDTEFWSVDNEGQLHRDKGQTLASVLVEPRLRNHGYATMLLDAVMQATRASGNTLTTLYSDVGPQLYRRSGHMLHPSQEVFRRVEAHQAWPDHVQELGMGDVADLLTADAAQQAAWLGASTAPAVCEIAHVERVAWFHTRTQYRSWARGQMASPVVGASAGADGWCLWTADSALPQLHVLAWRPRDAAGARRLTEACLAHAAERGLREVVWWDGDRDTGLDPYHRPSTMPTGAEARTRESSLPMLAWHDSRRPFPLVWMGIERLGWR